MNSQKNNKITTASLGSARQKLYKVELWTPELWTPLINKLNYIIIIIMFVNNIVVLNK
jgi:hypothetical protein